MLGNMVRTYRVHTILHHVVIVSQYRKLAFCSVEIRKKKECEYTISMLNLIDGP